MLKMFFLLSLMTQSSFLWNFAQNLDCTGYSCLRALFLTLKCHIILVQFTVRANVWFWDAQVLAQFAQIHFDFRQWKVARFIDQPLTTVDIWAENRWVNKAAERTSFAFCLIEILYQAASQVTCEILGRVYVGQLFYHHWYFTLVPECLSTSMTVALLWGIFSRLFLFLFNEPL